MKTLEDLENGLKTKVFADNSARILGLIELENTNNCVDLVKGYICNQSLESAFKDYPFATTWAIMQILRKNYGRHGSTKIYPILEEGLGMQFPENSAIRQHLCDGIKSICESLNILVNHYKRPYILHVQMGISFELLGHLADAFILQEKKSGLPSAENLEELKMWEKEVFKLLTPKVHSANYFISDYSVGWYTKLYLKLRNLEYPIDSLSDYERKFYEAIKSNI